jgi:uncharacterized spore protein YtfJ
MATKDILEAIIDKMQRTLHVEIAFGNPINIHNKTLIPVARIAYGFGAGSGTGSKNRKPNPEETDEIVSDQETASVKEEGGGGGGGGNTQPLGIFEVTESHTCFIPVITIKDIVALIAAIAVIIKIFVKHKRK